MPGHSNKALENAWIKRMIKQHVEKPTGFHVFIESGSKPSLTMI